MKTQIYSEKIHSKEALIRENKWILTDVTIFKPESGVLKDQKVEVMKLTLSMIMKK